MSILKAIFRAIGKFFIYIFYPFRWYKIPFILIVFYLLLTPVAMVYYYGFPDFFEIKEKPAKGGMMFNATILRLGDEMVETWLPNDIIYPTIFLDNPQNFQLGELEMLRYTIRMMRDKLSRLRTTDMIDENCDQAYVYISNDPKRWILPSAENRFKNAFQELREYQKRLESGETAFYARADNLFELLDQYNSLLGGINTRLSRAPRDQVIITSEETAGDQVLQGEKKISAKVPWRKIDDNFYFVRGVTYGLRQVMIAIKYEFKDVLELKRSTELVDRIIELSNLCQFEPFYVSNGKRGSFWPNHSLQLMATTEDIRQKIRSLQGMLQD